ncbi:MAG: DUF1570 domain-containing protein [Planctomycetaceae bacterium]
MTDHRRLHTSDARPARHARAWLLLWLAIAGCAASRTQLTQGLPDRHAVRGQQVLVLSDKPLPSRDDVLDELNHIQGTLRETLAIPPGKREVVVYLFADRDRYAQYMQDTHPNLPARRAFFIGTPRELAVYAYWGDQVITDLRHEYTHGTLHASIGNVPLWIDEGLAEYFEVGDGGSGAINPEHLGPLATSITTGWQPDLRRLERLEEIGEMTREDYREAWAWVHFLMHEAPQGHQIIDDYLNGIRRGENPPLISERLGSQLPAAEASLSRYVYELSNSATTLTPRTASRSARPRFPAGG